MKKIILLVLSALALTGCTQAQEQKSNDPLYDYIIENYCSKYNQTYYWHLFELYNSHGPKTEKGHYKYNYGLHYYWGGAWYDDYMWFILPKPKEEYKVIVDSDLIWNWESEW